MLAARPCPDKSNWFIITYNQPSLSTQLIAYSSLKFPCSVAMFPSPQQNEAFPPPILTLRAGGRFDSHFWTQSGAPSPYLAFRAPPRFQAIYGVESVPRFQPIFGTQSAPPPAFKLYMVLKACPPRFQPIFGTQSAPPLSSSIWC